LVGSWRARSPIGRDLERCYADDVGDVIPKVSVTSGQLVPSW
jgi:hypothetical protein